MLKTPLGHEGRVEECRRGYHYSLSDELPLDKSWGQVRQELGLQNKKHLHEPPAINNEK